MGESAKRRGAAPVVAIERQSNVGNVNAETSEAESVVQQQLDAYNARDIEAFMALEQYPFRLDRKAIRSP
jgi:hypothetical protein